MAAPYIIGITGPSGSGKTRISQQVADALHAPIFSLDSYYHGLSHLPPEERARTNFDHPDSLDSQLLSEQLHALARGESIQRPIYDFATNTRLGGSELVVPSDYLVVEGIFALNWDFIRELYGTKVFVEANHDVCLARRKKRDLEERGFRSEAFILWQYETTVRPMTDQFLNPTKVFADIVVDGCRPVEESAKKVLKHVRNSVAVKL
jgi:uridine kinase